MRNALGIFDSVFAVSGDRVEFPAFTTGWDADYSNPASGKYPERTAFNDLFAKLTALGVDVNTYGGALPWDTNIAYEQHAVVTGSDGHLYSSLAGSNQGNDPLSSPGQWSVVYVDEATFLAHVNSTTNPHSVTKDQVNLSNVLDEEQVVKSDEGFSVVDPVGGEVLSFDPNTATINEALDFIATFVKYAKLKGVV